MCLNALTQRHTNKTRNDTDQRQLHYCFRKRTLPTEDHGERHISHQEIDTHRLKERTAVEVERLEIYRQWKNQNTSQTGDQTGDQTRNCTRDRGQPSLALARFRRLPCHKAGKAIRKNHASQQYSRPLDIDLHQSTGRCHR